MNAGSLAAWIADGLGDVPCGDCTACCRSSQFIHIEPDEVDTLARIPKALRFPAPGLPKGHVLLGYDAEGRCPMFVDERCAIYDHRPRTCRAYDCRVFPAAGLAPDPPLIAEQAARWEFDLRTELDRRTQAAVLAAVDAVRAEAPGLRDADVAMAAVRSHGRFLG